MAKKSAAPSCYDGDDWLVIDSSRGESTAAAEVEEGDPQPEDYEGKARGLEASQTQNQTLDSDRPLHAQEDEEDLYEEESEKNQTSMKQEDCSLFQLLVWHSGLETPIELVDENQKPLLVSADEKCSIKDLHKLVLEMVFTQQPLRGVFPQVTRENSSEIIQVCERSGEKEKWVPLGDENEEMEESGDLNAARAQLISQVGTALGENLRCQLLLESRFEVARGGKLTDWRRGRFYSDFQENAWRFQLQIGQLVDALDTDKRWYESRIMDMDDVYVKVHYRGWTSKWDEWLYRTSMRLAPLHSKVPNWRAFQVNDEIMVGSEVPGKRYPEWRNACVTACDDDNGSLQIEVGVDGKKKWLDAQDELLCPKGTHKAVNAGTNANSAVLAVPPSLLFNYFEQPEELPLSPLPNNEAVDEVESVRRATQAVRLADSEADGDEWCVVVEEEEEDGDHVEEGTGAVTVTESHNQTDTKVEECEEVVSEGSDTSSASFDSASIALSRDIVSSTVDQIFATTAEVLGGQMETTISEEDTWRYQLQIDQLIDARDTDNVWYESRVVALSSTLVKVHYRGWTSKWDEWIERTSTRIAPLHSKVRNWRDFKVGNAVMVGHHVATKRYPEWRNAVVTACEACEMDGRLRIEVDVDGCKQWMDAQDEMLCPPGTHKAVNSSLLKHIVPLL